MFCGHESEVRTGRFTWTVMLLPGVTVVMSAGAPRLTDCASAEAARVASARMYFMLSSRS